MKPAVFLDRDGVLIEDVNLLTRVEQVRVPAEVPPAVAKLRAGGFQLIVVSNQAVVARGLASEGDVENINRHINRILQRDGGAGMDAFYFCPHHPNATVPAYRKVCDCRKPEPGMLLRAAREHNLDLKKSFMVGDRITDIVAGARAGTRTVLVKTGQHNSAPIETAEPIDQTIKPDHVCKDLGEAMEWILKNR
jgi:D-glycero-D-manno-heptose 1,7-bisphosphate phosphatase